MTRDILQKTKTAASGAPRPTHSSLLPGMLFLVSLILPSLAVAGGAEQAGVLSGRVTLENGRPRAYVSVTTLDGPSYGFACTNRRGEFRMTGLLPGHYRIHFFGPGLATQRLEVDSPVLRPIAVSMHPLPPRLAIYAYRRVVAPGHRMPIAFRAFRYGSARFRLYALADGQTVNGQTVPEDARLIREWRQSFRYSRPYSYLYEQAKLPLLQAGSYLVEALAGEDHRLVQFQVTGLGLVVKRSPSQLLVLATSLDSGAPYPGVSLHVFDGGDEIATGTTNLDGLFEAAVETSPNVRVVATHGRDRAVASAFLAPSANAHLKGYLFTDRPVYRPGQRVYLKAIARRQGEDGYQVPEGEPVELVVKDPLGQPVFRASRVLSDMGSTQGSFDLDREAALGEYAIELSLRGEKAMGRFKVLSYRKPEFKVTAAFDRDHYTPGETAAISIRASYYFGAPLKDVGARYAIYSSPVVAGADTAEWGGSGYSLGYGQLIDQGDLSLGPDGSGLLTFQVPSTSRRVRLSVEVEVTDQSHRGASGRANTVGAPGDYELLLHTGASIFSPGYPIALSVRAAGFRGQPVATDVAFEVNRRAYDASRRAWVGGVAYRTQATTSSQGIAAVTIPGLREGYYTVTASSVDRRGHRIETRGWFYVAGAGYTGFDEGPRGLDIVLDKTGYRPGETARAVVTGLSPGDTVLITRERDRIEEASVRRAEGSVLVLDLPLDETSSPNIFLAVSSVRHSEHRVRVVSIPVRSDESRLVVAVKTDRKEYRPGDTAGVTVTCRDGYGRPVAAEVSLAVVDEAIFAVSPELAPDIVRFFHGQRPNRVATVYSFSQNLLGGADKDASTDVRRYFKDTALFAPALRTDASGEVTVKVPLPDNLTRWRFTARAATHETSVGSGKSTALVTKKLIARIEAPRFFTAGDRAVLDLAITNRSDAGRRVEVMLDAKGAGRIVGGPPASVLIEPRGEAHLPFVVETSRPGAVRLVCRAVDRAGTEARSEDNRDGMETTIAVASFGRPFRIAATGEAGQSATLSIPSGTVPESLKTVVRVDPGVVSAAFGALPDLIGYPYGCAEQTMSRFLPTVIAGRVAKAMGVSLGPKESEVPKMVDQGTRRLYGYQHSDGGWGWWKNDPSHPYMTAYVTYGLLEAKKAGYPVDQKRIESGLRATAAFLGSAEDPNVKAFMLYTLARGGGSLGTAPAALFAERGRLSDYGRGLLLAVLAGNGDRERVSVLKGELESRARRGRGGLLHWDAETWNEGWMRNPVEATAYAIRGLAGAGGASAAGSAARWLVMQRKGGSWHSTKDTATAVLSLFAVARSGKEPSGADLLLDGRRIRRLSFLKRNLLDAVELPRPSLGAGIHRLEIERRGEGQVFYAASVKGVMAQEQVAAEGTDLKVRRSYRTADWRAGIPVVANADPLSGPIFPETMLAVTLDIEARADAEFVLLEDPLPAGFEIVSERGKLPAGWDRREERDDRIAFFRTKLPAGCSSVTYFIKSEMSGRFRVRPARIEATYTPGLEAHGTSDELRVLRP